MEPDQSPEPPLDESAADRTDPAPDPTVSVTATAERGRALLLGVGVLVLLLAGALGVRYLLAPETRDLGTTSTSSRTTSSATASTTSAPTSLGTPTPTPTDGSTAAPALSAPRNSATPTESSSAPTRPPATAAGPTTELPEPTWVQVWSEEFNGSGLGGGLYIDDHCQHPEYVEVSDGLLRLTVDGIGCGADVRTFRMFEPGLAVEYRARATAPPGYDTGTLTASVSLETGADGVGPWIYAGAFRTYRMEWVDGTVVCYQDGSVVGVPVRGFTYPSAFLRIWAYAIDPPAPFRALEIDYVRVYHRA